MLLVPSHRRHGCTETRDNARFWVPTLLLDSILQVSFVPLTFTGSHARSVWSGIHARPFAQHAQGSVYDARAIALVPETD
jgi:hypothetical protein